MGRSGRPPIYAFTGLGIQIPSATEVEFHLVPPWMVNEVPLEWKISSSTRGMLHPRNCQNIEIRCRGVSP